LLGNEAEPGGEVTSLLEAAAGADGCHQRTEMIGPIPGTVIKRWQAASFWERLSISAETTSLRLSRRCQS
jgi:hypothetical protein